MIEKLRRKLVWIVMSVVAVILLAVFIALVVTTQKNSERVSVGMLRQALGSHALSEGEGKRPVFAGRPGGPSPRVPILLVEVDNEGRVARSVNQLHFIADEEILAIAQLAADRNEAVGVLSSYSLRFLREETPTGLRIAFADISMEQEMLRTQVLGSLLVGGLAMVAFFLLSLCLARWAVRPVEQAWEEQKQFVQNASHELRTPLTVILSNAHMLGEEAAFAEGPNARRLEHIRGEGQRMKTLVEELLTLAQGDSAQGDSAQGDSAPTAVTVDMSDLVTSAALMYEPVFYDEGRSLSYHIEEGLLVAGDGLRLQQVIHILLDNAQKYAAPKTEVRLSLKRADHRHLLLQVLSQGEPIPPQELQKIFLRFYRRDPARRDASQSGQGSFGLGLSIAQAIVEGHGGRIWAETDGHSQNSFFVRLPLA